MAVTAQFIILLLFTMGLSITRGQFGNINVKFPEAHTSGGGITFGMRKLLLSSPPVVKLCTTPITSDKALQQYKMPLQAMITSVNSTNLEILLPAHQETLIVCVSDSRKNIGSRTFAEYDQKLEDTDFLIKENLPFPRSQFINFDIED